MVGGIIKRIARGSLDEILDEINICIDEGYGELEFNKQLKAEGYALIAKILGLSLSKSTATSPTRGSANKERINQTTHHSPLTTH